MPETAVDVRQRMDDVAPEWEALAEGVGAAPWLRPAWYAAWMAAFGRGQPYLITARRDGRLTGLLPLARSRSHLRSPSNHHTPAFGLVARDPATVRAIVDAVLSSDARRVDLRFVPQDDPMIEACLEASARAGRRTILRTIERSPVIDTCGPWEAYERGRRPHLVRELRRRRRRLGEMGRLEFMVEDGRTGLGGLLDEGFAVEGSGWKGDRGTAIASRPATHAFYTRIARWTSQCGWLRLAYLRLDGRAIAFDFAIEHDGVHYLLKTGYDPDVGRFAPGMLLRHEMLRRAFDSPVKRYEFLGHDDAWKLEWADATANQVDLQAFRTAPIGLVEWVAFAFGRPALKRLLGRRP